jgi:hypothetical protein
MTVKVSNNEHKRLVALLVAFVAFVFLVSFVPKAVGRLERWPRRSEYERKRLACRGRVDVSR